MVDENGKLLKAARVPKTNFYFSFTPVNTDHVQGQDS